MASKVSGIIEKVNSSGTAYSIASSAYGYCETAAGTAIKNVDMTGFTLNEGVTVHIKFANANSASNPKLKFNSEADSNAKPIVQYGTTAAGTTSQTNGWYAGAIVSLTYDGTSWVRDQGFNTNDNNFASQIGHYNNIKARAAITAESLIVGDATGYEKVASGVTFDISYAIVWCTAAVAKDSSNYANMFLQHYDRNIATGAKTGFTSAANKVIYLIVTINGNIATIDSNIITDTLPSNDDGKVYISLGKLGAQSTGANYFFFYPVHPMFWYKNGAIREYSGASQYALTAPLSGISDADDLKAIEALSGTTGLLKKTAANTWALDSSSYATSGHNHDDKYIKIDGTSDIGIVFGDNDKFLHFKYNTSSLINNSWRLGVLGSGTGDENYFVIQSGGVNNSSNGTWNNAIRIGQSTYNVYIGSSTASSSTTTGALTIEGGVGVKGSLYADKLYGAVWNDYAEYRQSTIPTPGACVVETDNGILMVADERLIPGACIISDTFGYAQGKTSKANTPIAVAGRVLAYPASPREWYHAGQAVCSAPGGYVDIMTREEIQKYPDAIVGIVSEIPDYEYWGPNNIEINGRIWIKVR